MDDDVACCGYAGFPDEGSFFLGIRALEKLYANHPLSGGSEGREEWIPFVSDQDSWAGQFIDARDGRIGRWFVGDLTVTGEYASLAHYFDSVAEMLTRIGTGDYPVRSVAEGRLVRPLGKSALTRLQVAMYGGARPGTGERPSPRPS
ncbi:SMI1/KNR4 family protein [Streptomyces sp. NPDC090021]|uniref:SMI1/KNR4 family protein n=1 Tax=Streptomyces sp. NPDC090021 TaxID=3365919 RepID=UPI0037FF7094